MVLLIGGASHTGKTVLAQRILEERHIPYLSIDHLKMGLIRSGQTELTPMDDEKLTPYLWPIVREMVKTAIENGQNLTVEGCYIPFDWKKDFPEEYLQRIRCVFLVMSEDYIRSHFGDIRHYANAIEQRLDDSGNGTGHGAYGQGIYAADIAPGLWRGGGVGLFPGEPDYGPVRSVYGLRQGKTGGVHHFQRSVSAFDPVLYFQMPLVTKHPGT